MKYTHCKSDFGAYSIFSWMVGGLTIAVTDNRLEGWEILGFLLFLTALLNVIDLSVMVANQWRGTILLLLAYVTSLALVMFLSKPPFLRHHYGEPTTVKILLGGASFFPSLIAKGLNYFGGMGIPHRYTHASYYYPLAMSFWLYTLFILILKTVHLRLALANSSPIPFLLSVYNFLVGAGLMLLAIAPGIGGVLAGLSLLFWLYLFAPRHGIPSELSSRRGKREIRRAKQELSQAEERLLKIYQQVNQDGK